MRKSILILFFNILLCNYLLSQSNDTLINKFNSKGKKQGKWVTYNEYEGDTLKNVCYYKNGLLTGKSFTYYPNGKLHSENSFKNNLKDGKSKFYYKDGTLSDIYLFQNDNFLLHLKFTNKGSIFQESNGDKVIQYENGIPK